MKAFRYAGASIALVLFALMAMGPGVSAQTNSNASSLAIRSIDTTKWPRVTATVQYAGDTPPGPGDFSVRESGKIVRTFTAKRIAETPTPIGVVLVIDTSGSMRAGGRLDAAKAAVRSFVANRAPAEQIAVVSFSDVPHLTHGFTPDDGATAAVEGLGASGETALWDAVGLGIGLLTDRPDLQPNIVVLSDGRDTVSVRQPQEVRAAAQAAHVVVHTLGIQGDNLDNKGLADLASATGGQSFVATGASGVDGLFAQIRRSLNQQFEVSWVSTATSPGIDMSVSIPGAIASGRAAAGAVSRGAQTRPEIVKHSGPVAAFGSVGRLVALGGVLLAVAFLVIGFGLAGRGSESLLRRLQSYGTGEEEVVGLGADDGPRPHATTSFVRRAVEATERAADERGLLAWVEARLDAARIPIRAAEACFFTAAFAVIAAVGAFVLKGPIFGLIALVLGVVAPLETTAFLAYRRRRKFVKQLPQMLQLLGSSLRAGYALLQGVEAVSKEIEDPMGAELRRVMAEARLGRPLELALEEAAERMGSPDFAWAVMAIGIQRDVGGNLAELLDTVADTMVARNRLKAEVRALTAEGRMSAMVLGFMPPGLGVAMMVISPGYLNPLFSQTIGKVMLGACGVMMLVGFAWMRKIIEVKI
ncbi:MAG: tight adherence protein [Actinomycetota bacterium]